MRFRGDEYDILETGLLIAVFLVAVLVSLTLSGHGESSDTPHIRTQIGTYNLTSFDIPNDEEAWMGFTTPVAPGTERLVAEPVIPIKGEEDWPTWRYRSNSDGIRDEDVPSEKPEHTARILFLGASRLMGNFVNESHRYTERLQAKLNNATGQRFRVINAGVPSTGMFDYYLFLQTIGWRYHPDVVVISFVWTSDMSRAERLKMDNTIYDAAPSDEIARRVDVNVERWYAKHITWNTSEVRRYGTKITRLARERGITPVFMTTKDTSRTRMELYRRWTDRMNVPFIGPPERFQNSNITGYRFADGHYTPKGHALIARHLYERLSPVLGVSDG